MQVDAYAHFVLPAGFSLNLIVGDRGITRPTDDSVSGRITSAAHRFISREHYLMWRPSATGPYARIGRYFPVYGLRLVEHIFYVRRFTGNALYEEPYALSGGYIADDWEVHASAFTSVPSSFPDFFQSIGYGESGGTAYGEMRFAGMAALALQTRIGVADEQSRYQGGAVAKVWYDPAKLMFLGEADVIRQQIKRQHRPDAVRVVRRAHVLPDPRVDVHGGLRALPGRPERQEHRAQRVRSGDQLLPLGAHRAPRARAHPAQRRRIERDLGYASIPLLPMTAAKFRAFVIGVIALSAAALSAGCNLEPDAARQADVRGRRAADLHVPLHPLPRLAAARRSDASSRRSGTAPPTVRFDVFA